MHTIAITILVAGLALAAPQVNVDRRHKVDCAPATDCSERTLFGDNFEWQEKEPLEFLEELKVVPSDLIKTVTPYVVLGKYYSWIKAQDISGLMPLVDSTEPCLAVLHAPANDEGPFLSTVGHEAMYLIEGYRAGVYPPAGLSTTWQANGSEEIKKWFLDFKRDTPEAD